MKRWLVLSMCFVFLCALTGCNNSDPYLLTEEQEVQREKETRIAVQILNENSDFEGIQLLQPYEGAHVYVNSWIDIQDSGNSVPAFDTPSPIEIFDKEGNRILCAYYWFYPRTTSDMVINCIELEESVIKTGLGNNLHNIFGIKPGIEMQDALEILANYGYSEQKPEGPYAYFDYGKNKNQVIVRNADVLIILERRNEGDCVAKITIEVFDLRIAPTPPG